MADFKAREPSDDGRTREKWSIANMDNEIRDRAVTEADRRRMRVAEFVEAAIVLYLENSDSNPPPKTASDPQPSDALARVERAIAAAAALASGRGKPVPGYLSGALNRALLATIPTELLREHGKAMAANGVRAVGTFGIRHDKRA